MGVCEGSRQTKEGHGRDALDGLRVRGRVQVRVRARVQVRVRVRVRVRVTVMVRVRISRNSCNNSTHPFTCHLISSYLMSSHAYLMLTSSHLISCSCSLTSHAHLMLISFHCISSHLIPSYLISRSSLLISSHLISSHLISSHLISSHSLGAPGPDFAHFFGGLAGALKKADKSQKADNHPRKSSPPEMRRKC